MSCVLLSLCNTRKHLVDGYLLKLLQSPKRGELLGFLFARTPGRGKTSLVNNNAHLETFAMIGSLLVEHLIQRRSVQHVLGMLLQHALEVLLMAAGISVFDIGIAASVGHKEISPGRKIDPRPFDMGLFRDWHRGDESGTDKAETESIKAALHNMYHGPGVLAQGVDQDTKKAANEIMRFVKKRWGIGD